MTKKSSNPLKAVLAIKKEELPLALLMFSYFFLVITVFWILKPIKKTLFVDYYHPADKVDLFGFDVVVDPAVHFDIFGASFDGAQAELIAKVLNMGVAFVAVVAFTMLARNLRRQQLTFAFSAFCIVCLGVFTTAVNSSGPTLMWAFYLFGDLFNTLMVATFFAFLNDSFRPASAKRNYGVIVLGGVAGGAFGSMFVRLQIKTLLLQQWLLICMGLTLVIAIVAWAAGRQVAKNPPPEKDEDGPGGKPRGNAALEGARLVARSRYLLAIVTIVAIYEIVSTILDYQFTATILHYVAKPDRGATFSLVYTITNVFALAIQLIGTGLILNKFGVKWALLIMPAAIISASTLYLIIPLLWFGNMLNTVDNGLNYSVNQSAREALYTPTTRDEKYKAKAFIDMFVQRFAKAIAVFVTLGITSVFTSFGSLRILSVFVLVLAAVWVVAARYAGSRFEELEGDEA